MRKRAKNFKLKASIIETGKNFNQILEESNMSRTSLARKINGHTEFTETEMEILSKILNKPVTDIFFNSDGSKTEQFPSEISFQSTNISTTIAQT